MSETENNTQQKKKSGRPPKYATQEERDYANQQFKNKFHRKKTVESKTLKLLIQFLKQRFGEKFIEEELPENIKLLISS